VKLTLQRGPGSLQGGQLGLTLLQGQLQLCELALQLQLLFLMLQTDLRERDKCLVELEEKVKVQPACCSVSRGENVQENGPDSHASWKTAGIRTCRKMYNQPSGSMGSASIGSTNHGLKIFKRKKIASTLNMSGQVQTCHYSLSNTV
jgi:hypothetical protein